MLDVTPDRGRTIASRGDKASRKSKKLPTSTIKGFFFFRKSNPNFHANIK